MKLSKKDVKILLMFFGVLFLVLSYFFVYKPQMEEASQIEAQNVPLQERLDQLLEMAKNREFYEQETESMKQEIEEYCRNFPASVKQEDGIVLAKNMESSLDIKISSVGLGQSEFLYSLDGQSSEERIDNASETLMQQGNAATEEQIRELEEMEGLSEEEARKKAEAQNAVDAVSDTLDILLFTPSLYRVQDTLQFQCTYNSLKEAVKYLANQTGRMTLNNVNASFDSATGNLSGSMAVNLYYMTGANTSYYEPDAGSVAYGTDNIFGTIETPANPENAGEDNPEEAQNAEGGEAPAAEGEGAGEAAPQ